MNQNDVTKIQLAYQHLVSCLEDLTKNYRHLLDLIRKEKDLLIQVDVPALDESNKAKEAFLYKIRSFEISRERHAKDLALAVGANAENPRLLEIAIKMQGPAADRLRSIHSALDLILKRVSELNKENEIYAASVLKTLDGALGEIRETVSGKKTYERKGRMNQGPDKAGNFVSKEA